MKGENNGTKKNIMRGYLIVLNMWMKMEMNIGTQENYKVYWNTNNGDILNNQLIKQKKVV